MRRASASMIARSAPTSGARSILLMTERPSLSMMSPGPANVSSKIVTALPMKSDADGNARCAGQANERAPPDAPRRDCKRHVCEPPVAATSDPWAWPCSSAKSTDDCRTWHDR